MAKTKRTYSYHTYHSYKNSKGEKVFCRTQLYQIGVYAIINDNPALQFNWPPSALVRIEKKLLKDEAAGKISDLQLTNLIKVSDSTGFWEEVA